MEGELVFNWDAIGAMGELVGALAVVLTLAYLARQLRQNTREMRRQGQSDLTARRQAIWFHMFDDKEKAQIFFKGLDNDFDDRSDAYFFANQLLPQLYHYQDCMTQHAEGILDEDLWQAEKNMLGSIVGDPGFLAIWPTMRVFFPPAFVELIDNLEHSGAHIDFDFETGEWKHTTRVPRADN